MTLQTLATNSAQAKIAPAGRDGPQVPPGAMPEVEGGVDEPARPQRHRPTAFALRRPGYPPQLVTGLTVSTEGDPAQIPLACGVFTCGLRSSATPVRREPAGRNAAGECRPRAGAIPGAFSWGDAGQGLPAKLSLVSWGSRPHARIPLIATIEFRLGSMTNPKSTLIYSDGSITYQSGSVTNPRPTLL